MKNQTSKKQPIRPASAKKVIKNKKSVVPNKYAILDEHGYDWSLIEERDDKCVIVFPTNPYAQGCIDGDIGLIALIMMKGLGLGKINLKDPCEISYSYDKKLTEKIRKLQYAWFNHSIKVDGKDMSDTISFLVNYFLPTGPKHNFSGKPMYIDGKLHSHTS